MDERERREGEERGGGKGGDKGKNRKGNATRKYPLLFRSILIRGDDCSTNGKREKSREKKG